MNKKVKNINEQRKKSKPRSLDDSAKAAVRRYCDPDLLDSIEEPEGLASGKTSPTGSFVDNNDDSQESEDKPDEK